MIKSDRALMTKYGLVHISKFRTGKSVVSSAFTQGIASRA